MLPREAKKRERYEERRGEGMIKKEMIAMLLAGGQGSRLGVLTEKVAKPAVSFGGKYRIIDFTLSNCINSGVDTVGVLTQYQPLRLNSHIGIGIPWDLDKNIGGVTVLSPHKKYLEVEADAGCENIECYTGTANAVFQNLEYIESYHPEYVLILSGDHIYKMDYEDMLNVHKSNDADITVAKRADSENNLKSMGIYIFKWNVLKEVLASGCDFEKHVIPYCLEQGKKLIPYEFKTYWKDIGTLSSYWEANMELIEMVPDFDLYDDFWKVYTNGGGLPPQYLSEDAVVEKSIVCNGAEIYGEVYNSIIGAGVVVEEGSIVRDSVVMQDTLIGKRCVIEKAIIAENVKIKSDVVMGIGEEVPNTWKPDIYTSGLVTIGECSVIPANVQIGKNTVISGVTKIEDYENGMLESGGVLIKAGEQA